MKFKLVENKNSGLKDEPTIDTLNEVKYRKRDMGPLRQFIGSVLEFVDGKTISGYDIHHLDGDNSNSSVSNVVLLPHNIHSKISGNKNISQVKQLLLDNAIKLEVSINATSLNREEIDELYDKLSVKEKELAKI